MIVLTVQLSGQRRPTLGVEKWERALWTGAVKKDFLGSVRFNMDPEGWVDVK